MYPAKSAGRTRKQTPRWSEHIQPPRINRIFWHQLWRDNGSPTSDWLAEIHKKTRVKYHYYIRQKCKKDIILASKQADSIIDKTTNEFSTKNGCTILLVVKLEIN